MLFRSHHANDSFRFDAERLGAAIAWQPYEGVPGVLALADAEYEHAPDWYWRFLYDEERRRGLDSEEDLASPGVFRWEASRREAVLVLAADTPELRGCFGETAPRDMADRLMNAERRRRAASSRPVARHRPRSAMNVSRPQSPNQG